MTTITTISKVVLIGGAGTLGSAILSALLSSNFEIITVLSRTDSTTVYPDHIQPVKTDYSFDSLVHIFSGHHAVIHASGLGGISSQKTVVDACVAAGVYRYVTNDFGNPPDFVGLPELEFARQPKLAILDYVKQQQQQTSLTWTALATGHFIDYALRKVPQAIGFDLVTHRARIIDGGSEPFSMTTVPDIARAVLGILLHPTATTNAYLVIRTLETTQNDILRALQTQTHQTWDVEHINSKDLYEVGKQKQKEGDQRGAILDLLPVQIFEKGKGRSTLPHERYDNALLQIREKNVDEVVGDVLRGMQMDNLLG